MSLPTRRQQVVQQNSIPIIENLKKSLNLYTYKLRSNFFLILYTSNQVKTFYCGTIMTQQTKIYIHFV